jgi:AraC family transcriptional regulator of adaptative response / DNA-3-methyladenine glycosylase II
MSLDPIVCHAAMDAKDRRFDGVFFVGIQSTGIYCRPICPARQTKREHRAFFPSAAAAEKDGYRPCLRCRPELAPGKAPMDSISRLASRAYSRIEDGALSELSLAELAEQLGITDRHLRRVVEREYGVSPVELAQTQRLLLAKRLLRDTELSAYEVAFASGFSSERRFYALFKERYRMSPLEVRKSRRTTPEFLTAELSFRKPFDFHAHLKFLRGRQILGVESISSDTYRRTVRLGESRGWIEVTAQESSLLVKVSASLAGVFPKVLTRVKRLFDLYTDPEPILATLGDLAVNPGLRVPGAFDGFEMAVRAILGQQVTVVAATTLSGRIAARFGEPIETPFDDLTMTFPSASTIAEANPEDISILGMPRARGRTIVEFAKRNLRLEPYADPEPVIQQLKEIPGIGEWTAQYIAMRALAYPDAFPVGDVGIRNALLVKSPTDMLAGVEQWRPWRAYAVIHLWNSLESK